MSARLSYEDSCRFLQREGWLKDGQLPAVPERPPRYDDEILGVEFFRTWVEAAKLENLTLPRTYFSRSKISDSSFANTDLSESVANWNDFEDVDFSSADLTRSDLRGCMFIRTRFNAASLQEADLRCCGFEECDFSHADMKGAKLTIENGKRLVLSEDQSSLIDWHQDDGPDPDGG